MAEVAAAVGSFLALVPAFLDLGSKWYKANGEWKKIPAQLEDLQRKHELAKSISDEYGLSDNHHLRKMLEEAQRLVELELKRMARKRNVPGCGGWCFKATATVFPHKLEKLIEDIQSGYNVVPAMQQRRDTRELIKSEAFAKVHSFNLSKESVKPYVPLSDIEKRISDALENKDGPAVICLHGNPGTGKSILARYMVVRYKKFTPENAPFSSIVFLECGLEATIASKQLELLRKLSPEHSSDLTHAYQIENRLQCLLRKRSALVILDDVWKRNFVKAFVCLVNGSSHDNVKFLVTSRKSMLWEDSVQVPTERIKLKDAEKILASHAGLPNNDLPQDLKDVAQGLIDRAEYNPLALAMVAKRINRKKNNDVGEWKRVAKSYVTAMKEDVKGEGTSQDLRPVLDFSYEKNIWETLLMAYRELKADARCLLVLIANCEGKSIPNHVVYMLYSRLLHARGEGDPELFDDHKNELMGSGTMLQSNIQSLEYRDPLAKGCPLIKKEYETLGLHDLQRNFINHHGETRKDVEEVMTSLLKAKSMPNTGPDHNMICDDRQGDAVFALCALYLQGTLAENAAENLGMSALDYGHSKKLRGAMENLVYLMQDRLPEYNETLAQCVKQVYVKVVRNGQLDDNSLQILVSSLHYGPPTISALGQLWTTGLCTVYHTPGTIKRLLESGLTSQHTDESSCSPYEKLHLHGLGRLALFGANIKQIVEFPGALQRLMGCLSLGQNSTLREIAAEALGNIAANEDGRRGIGRVPGSISQLLTFILQSDGTVKFEEKVLKALANLVQEDTTYEQIVEFPGALQGFVNCLSGEKDSKVRERAVLALGNIAHHEDGRRRIGEVPELISKLLKLFLQGVAGVDFQAQVVRTLSNSSIIEANAKQILDFPGVLEALLDGLCDEISSPLTKNVAWALANIATHEDGRRRIGEVPGSISKLLKLFLQGVGSLDFQAQVVRTLSSLGIDEANAKQILDFPGALEALLDGLSGRTSSPLTMNVAWTLANIASHQVGRRSIGGVPESIPKLLKLFLQGVGRVDFQAQVVRTLCSLSSDEANAKQILDFPGALEALLDGLSGGTSSPLTMNVAWTLANIACHQDGRRSIGGVPESIPKILTRLFLPGEETVEYLQEQLQLVRTLGNLAVIEANAKHIADSPGAIQGLVDFLSREKSSLLMENVVRTLANIAYHEDGYGRKLIGEVPGSISTVCTLLRFSN